MPKAKKTTKKVAPKEVVEEVIDTSDMTQNELWEHEGRCFKCGKMLPESFVTAKDTKFCSPGCSV